MGVRRLMSVNLGVLDMKRFENHCFIDLVNGFFLFTRFFLPVKYFIFWPKSVFYREGGVLRGFPPPRTDFQQHTTDFISVSSEVVLFIFAGQWNSLPILKAERPTGR